MSLSHTTSSDSEQGGNSSGRESGFELSSIMEGDLNEGSNGRGNVQSSATGDTGNAVGPNPVARQTTLVLQGFMAEEARVSNPYVREHFATLQGAGNTTADEELILQLGSEMYRASLQLREMYADDFEVMMGELGTSVSEIFQGLSEIASRLFQNHSEITWARILTFLSFASWVLIKKGFKIVEDAFKQARKLLLDLTTMLGNMSAWVSSMGGWSANRSHLTNQAELQDDVSDSAMTSLRNSLSRDATGGHQDVIDPIQNVNVQVSDTDDSSTTNTANDPNSSSSQGLNYMAIALGAVAVGVAFFVYKKLK